MRFAQLLHHYGKDQRLSIAPVAAKEAVGKETAAQYPLFVIKIAQEWPFDPDVIAELDRLDSILPTRERSLHEAWTIATDKYKEPRDRIAALRLYCDVNGWTINKKESMSPNEMLGHLQALHNAVTNPAET